MIDIPDYKIHREIDSSDYCHSFSAIQLSTGKTMVISVFSHAATQYTSFQSFFDNIEKKLAHHVFGVIAPIKEFIKTSDHTYIISDLLSNSCQQTYKDKTVNTKRLFNEAYKIALSLNLYHQVGFYHGGVSLDNLFYDRKNNLMLGLAAFNKNFSSEDKAFNLEQECYNAPEKETLSKSRDFYSLGVVLFELIFKQKPFQAHSIDQLNRLKSAAIIQIPDKNLQHLKPIFTALLNSNPEQRISTAAEFKTIATNLDIQIDDISYSISPLTASQKISKKDIKEQPSKKLPVYYLYAAATLALVVIILIFMPISEQSIPQNKDINTSNNLIEELPDNETHSYSTKKLTTSPYDENDFSQFIDSAKVEINKKQYASALMAINQALKIHPSDQQAINIQQIVQNELKINAIIQNAKQQLSQGLLISPQSNNAFNTYKKLQQILPKSDNRAKNGFKQISDRYYSIAFKQHNAGKNKIALSTIQNGLSVTPKHLNLSTLQNKIITTLEDAKQVQKAKAVEEENIRLAVIKQQAIDTQKELDRKEQLKRLTIQQEENRKAQINKQNILNNLYAEAENHLKDTQLTVDSINKANDKLIKIQNLPSNPAKNLQLKLKIDNAFVSLTEYQISVNDYQLAQNTITQGLTISSQNLRLKTFNNQIKTLLAQQKIERQQPKKEALPIFGTF